MSHSTRVGFFSSILLLSLWLAPGSARADNSATLFHSGLWTFAGTYTASVVVATVSPRRFDDALYIPVAGPFIDFARRDCEGCNHETLNRVLLVGDGVLQTIGVIEMVAALTVFRPNERGAAYTHQTAQQNFTVSPTRFGAGGYGLMARGSF